MGQRRPYNRGKSRIIRDLEVGEEVTLPVESERDYDNWRSIGYRTGKVFGAYFKFARTGDKFTITRIS